MISGLPHKVDDNCALLGHYAACSGNFLPTFRDNPWVSSTGVDDPEEKFLSFSLGFFTPKDGTVRLSRNVGKKLPLLAA